MLHVDQVVFNAMDIEYFVFCGINAMSYHSAFPTFASSMRNSLDIYSLCGIEPRNRVLAEFADRAQSIRVRDVDKPTNCWGTASDEEWNSLKVSLHDNFGPPSTSNTNIVVNASQLVTNLLFSTMKITPNFLWNLLQQLDGTFKLVNVGGDSKSPENQWIHGCFNR